ncbi:MAG: SRPBCC domain-containing protein [Imperialibacter sp.]
MEPSKPVNITMDIPIEAGVERVWECLIKDVGLWWRKDFYTSPKTKAFILEPKVGGRMYEDYGNGEGLLWYTVIVLNAPHHLELQGHLTPDYGGPAITFLKITLKEDGSKTMLTLSDTLMGDVSAKAKGQITEGWKLLFEDGFKTYVNTKP